MNWIPDYPIISSMPAKPLPDETAVETNSLLREFSGLVVQRCIYIGTFVAFYNAFLNVNPF
jgi:hypothetical protein